MARSRITEKAFLRLVVDLAKVRRWRVYHTFDSRRSNPGFPDLVLVRPPRLVACELKVPPNKTTPAQDGWIADLRACGVEVHVLTPDDWHVIESILE